MKGLVFMGKHLIFVYGTLKKNCRNNNYLSDAKYIGLAETTEKYSMREHSFHYPAVIESEQEYYIKGELWLCSDRTLKLLDRLEGIPEQPSFNYTPTIPYGIRTTYALEKGSTFYMFNGEKDIERIQPKFWLFGHMHDKFDFIHKDVRFLCNPNGYPGETTYTVDSFEL
jgi:gamma-glutamylcyclotransferase (GGCT)/AIG2-like uncharacterized protein YtfP